MADKFNAVFTWNPVVLSKCPNAILFEHAGTWILPSMRQVVSAIPMKKLNVSFVSVGSSMMTIELLLNCVVGLWQQGSN